MTQYKDHTQQAGEPQTHKKWLIEWLTDFAMMGVLIVFALSLVTCQPA